MLNSLTRRARERLLSTPDTVCLERAWLVTEAYRRYANEPVPIRRARAFEHVLRNMTLDLQTNPVFAGNTSSRPRAWMLLPEYGVEMDAQVLLENPGLAGLLDGAFPDELQAFWADKRFGGQSSVGHLAVDMQRVVHEGLVAVLAELGEYAGDDDPERQVYRRAMAISLQAVIDWAGRYAEAAECAAREAQDPHLRESHTRVASACRQVPAKPARNLFEGLQAMALVHLAVCIEGQGMSVSIGSPDRILAPFVDETFDPERAADLIAAFMLKITANSFLGRGYKSQTLTVGGRDARGADRCNALTLCFLDACDRLRVGDPPLFLRWHAGLDPQVKQRAADMLARGVSMPLLVNDPPTAQGFINAGIAEEDAWEYCVVGCNELAIPGRLAESACCTSGTIQYLGLLNTTLLEHPNPATLCDMLELLACLETTMSRQAAEMRAHWKRECRRAVDIVPTPFTSALMRGCARRGQDLLVGMDHHNPGLYERGLTNAANALAAIEEVVFVQRTMTMPALIEAMRGNFEDALARARLRRAPKWGNDDERADRWARELVAMRERVLDAVDDRFGHRPHFVCHVVRSLHHLDGRHIAASPDGRLAGAPVADSIGAETGTAAAGPTGVLNSTLKLDAARNYRGGYNLNVTLPAGRMPETEMRAGITALVDGFFGQGGQELQINSLNADVLRDAQAHPERHGDLLVRIAGLSARFVDLPPLEQDELIQRAEAA